MFFSFHTPKLKKSKNIKNEVKKNATYYFVKEVMCVSTIVRKLNPHPEVDQCLRKSHRSTIILFLIRLYVWVCLHVGVCVCVCVRVIRLVEPSSLTFLSLSAGLVTGMWSCFFRSLTIASRVCKMSKTHGLCSRTKKELKNGLYFSYYSLFPHKSH